MIGDIESIGALVDVVANGTTGMVASLEAIRRSRLAALAGSGHPDKVVRRIVDHDAVVPKLDVAKFNSAV